MFSKRLRLARQRAGLSLRALADTLDVSHQAIKKYEDGEMYPSSRVLISISKTLGVSLDFLMSDQVIELSGVEFRKHSGTNEKDRARVEALVIEEAEKYLEIESILGIEEDNVNLKNWATDHITSYEVAEGVAERFRAYWNLGEDPIPDMTALLEERAFKIVATELPDGMSGLICEVARKDNKASLSVIVVAKNNNNYERWRFTLAHELAHKIIPCNLIHSSLDKEKVMNRFAGAFLVPKAHLLKEVGESRNAFAYQELFRLKHYYGVSAACLCCRLKDAGIISEYALTQIFRHHKGWLKEEPEGIINENSSENPTRFKQLVYRALAEKLISLPRAAELLRDSIANLELQLRGPSNRENNNS